MSALHSVFGYENKEEYSQSMFQKILLREMLIYSW